MDLHSQEVLTGDDQFLALFRREDAVTVQQLVDWMQVTPTAVRQRLNRFAALGLVEKKTPDRKKARGRPHARYGLTALGLSRTGQNFTDLANVLWDEIRAVSDLEVRRGLLGRVAKRLEGMYAGEIRGGTPQQRMESLANVMKERRIPVEVKKEGPLPVLTVLACPYPTLAERDRTICSVERMLFSGLIGESVRLSGCRLDGSSCCSFETSPATATAPEKT